MAFPSVELSEIVRVDAGSCRRSVVRAPENRWVWIEDYDLPVAPEPRLTPNLKRSRYAINEGNAPNAELGNFAQLRYGDITIFWRDKSKIERVLRSLVPTAERGAIELLKRAYRSGKLGEKTVLVMKDYGTSYTTEQYSFKAYCPVEGLWIGEPRIEFNYGVGHFSAEYDLIIPANNKRTELCNRFVIEKKLHFQRIHYQNEETGEVLERHRFLWGEGEAPDKYGVCYVLCDVRWSWASNQTETKRVLIDRAYPDKTFREMRKSRDDFKEELVKAVFHPTRVERMLTAYGWGEKMGDPCWFEMV